MATTAQQIAELYPNGATKDQLVADFGDQPSTTVSVAVERLLAQRAKDTAIAQNRATVAAMVGATFAEIAAHPAQAEELAGQLLDDLTNAGFLKLSA